MAYNGSGSRTQGRMIRKSISESSGFASLTPPAGVLFCMIIPYLSAHGKMSGGAGYVKDIICPKIPYLTYENIPILLKEINEKTNLKWFEHEGRMWIHSINFEKHQQLDQKKLGEDKLPDFPGDIPDHGPLRFDRTPDKVEPYSAQGRDLPKTFPRPSQDLPKTNSGHIPDKVAPRSEQGLNKVASSSKRKIKDKRLKIKDISLKGEGGMGEGGDEEIPRKPENGIAPSGAQKGAKAETKKTAPEGYHEAIDLIRKKWISRSGDPPDIDGETGKAVKRLLKTYSIATVMAMVDFFWDHCGEWTEKHIGRNIRGLQHIQSTILDHPAFPAMKKKYEISPCKEVSEIVEKTVKNLGQKVGVG